MSHRGPLRRKNEYGGSGACGRGRRNRAAFWLLVLAAALPLASVFAADESPRQRRLRIEKMTPAQKEELRRKHQRFIDFEPAERQRLQELQRQISQDRNAAQLRRVMKNYCRWLSTLKPYDRAELLDMEPSDRIQRIKELRKKEAERPKREDIEGVLRWMSKYAAEHEDQIIRAIPEHRRTDIEELDKEKRRRVAMFSIMMRLRQRPRPGSPPSQTVPLQTEQNLGDLRSLLSPEMREFLQEKQPAEQWGIVASWGRHVIRHVRASRRLGGRPHPGDLDKELDEFFKNLSSEEKGYLLSLPSEEMQEKLREMYTGRFRPPGPPRGMRGPGMASPSHGERPDRRGPGAFGPDSPRGGPRGESSPGRGPRSRSDKRHDDDSRRDR